MGEIHIVRANPNQTIRIDGVKAGKLQYQIEEQGKQTQIKEAEIQAGDTIKVDLIEGANDGSIDSFSVGKEADLTEYNLLITGGKGNEYIGFAGGAKLGNLTLNTAAGDDSVQFGEGVTARKIIAKLGAGKDSFQVFNRYQDQAYRKGDDRFKDEKVNAARAAISGLTADELKVDEGTGEDLFLLGSYAKVANGVEVLGGNPDQAIDPARELEIQEQLNGLSAKMMAALEKEPLSESEKALLIKLHAGTLTEADYQGLRKLEPKLAGLSEDVQKLSKEMEPLLEEIGLQRDGITVMDQVDATVKLDGGRGNDYIYVGTRRDLSPVEINNNQDRDNIDIDKAQDVTLTNDQPLKLTVAINELEEQLGQGELNAEQIKKLNEDWSTLQAGINKGTGTVRIRSKS